MTQTDLAASGLAALARRIHAELALFEHPPKEWVTPLRGPRGERVRDVVVLGSGQGGLAVAFGLMRERVTNIEVLDASPAGQEGPWVTTARMITLRTLKHLTGPDLGLPALTFRAWHEAQFGQHSWNELARIPKGEWMRYLNWFRDILGLPVRNLVRLERIEPQGDLLALHLRSEYEEETLLTRKLVVANGIEGAGKRRVPAWVDAGLPREAWAHTAEAINFDKLAGKRVAVMGAGASAFDNAATALEAGAARVDVFIRRPELPTVNAFRVLETRGFLNHFADAPDADRWRFMRRLLSLPMPPPQDTLHRVTRHSNAHLHFASPLLDARLGAHGTALRLRTPDGWHDADFLVLGTGYSVDLADRPEFAEVVGQAAIWGDRYTPPPALADAAAARYPYLGSGFELTEKTQGEMPMLRNIHLFNIGAVVSMGTISGGLNGMPFGVPRLVRHLCRDLFMLELDRAYAEFAAYDEADPWEVVRTQRIAP